MRILRSADYRRMPWKNGKGETVEIAVFPQHASVSDFDWRISMATVAEDGPFSMFEGIDRTLCVIDGKGITLEVEGRDPVLLTCESVPYIFPGDRLTTASLIDGGITDLNTMSRRGRFSHEVMALDALRFPIRMDVTTFVLCIGKRLDVWSGDRSDTLEMLDCGMFAPGEEAVLSGAGFIVRIFPA